MLQPRQPQQPLQASPIGGGSSDLVRALLARRAQSDNEVLTPLEAVGDIGGSLATAFAERKEQQRAQQSRQAMVDALSGSLGAMAGEDPQRAALINALKGAAASPEAWKAMGGASIMRDLISQQLAGPEAVDRVLTPEEEMSVFGEDLPGRFQAPFKGDSMAGAPSQIGGTTPPGLEATGTFITRGGEVDQTLTQQNRAARLAEKAAGKTTVENTVNVGAEKEAEKAFGKRVGEQAGSILDAGDMAGKSRAQADSLETLMGAYLASGGEFGAFAEEKISIGKVLKAIGSDPTRLGLPNSEAIGAGEALISQTNEMVLGKIGGEGGGMPANNFSDKDREFLQSTVPQISNTEQGLRWKLEISRRIDQRNMAAAERLTDLRAEGKSLEEATRTIRREFSGKPMFTDEEKAAIQNAKPVRNTLPGDQSDLSGMSDEDILRNLGLR